MYLAKGLSTAVSVNIPKLAFSGIGWIGKNRMEAIIKNQKGTASYIIEPSPGAVKEAGEIISGAVMLNSVEEIIGKDVDGLIIATPSALHAEQAILALKHNIPVFCQKPLGRNLIETAFVVEMAERSNSLLGVDLSYRSTNAFIALKNVIDNGTIGDIFSANLVFHNAYGPDKEWFYNYDLSGGGCLIDLGTHLIDLALLTLNFPNIKKVNSHIYSGGKKITYNDKVVEDFVQASLLTENGTAINLSCSWNLSAGCDAIIEASFYGTRGGVSFKNINGSFYDFETVLNKGTKKEILASPPDNWSGRAAVEWAEKLSENSCFDSEAYNFIKTAEVIDKIYGRYS
jgi:predicted dehydrogenase